MKTPRPRPLAGLVMGLAVAAPAPAQDRPPPVSDFRAAPTVPGLAPHLPVGLATPSACARCDARHPAHEACTQFYKAFNGWVEPPYHTQNWIYGYHDYAAGRGPLITLGSRSLVTGFRGFGLIGSPGYGAGQRPISRVDLEVLGGCRYPGARALRPRWP